MSRKHPHRAGNQPVTRRYVAGVVRRARDEIISAIVHDRDARDAWSAVRLAAEIDSPSPERLHRAVNG